MVKSVFFIVIGIVVLGMGWYLISPLFVVIERQDEVPGTEANVVPGQPLFDVLSQGDFVPAAHEVKGKAVLGRTHRGDFVLRFEDFETVNGPDLRVYLSASQDSVDDAIDLGLIRGTKGNINYELPTSTNIALYPYVLVWCRVFRVLFSVAELKP